MKKQYCNPYSVTANLLADPMHILFLRLLAKAFGTFRQKSYMNVLERGAYAYGVLRGQQFAQSFCFETACFAEFGVAEGNGLDVLCGYANKAEMPTRVLGFDTGDGLPTSCGWKDHPEMWAGGDYKPHCDLERKFKDRATIVIGNVDSCSVTPPAPIVFASLDLDYHSSTLSALEYLRRYAAKYCSLYFDDTVFSTASELRGQLLAIREFNESHKGECCVTPDTMVRVNKIVRHAQWYDRMYIMHKRCA